MVLEDLLGRAPSLSLDIPAGTLVPMSKYICECRTNLDLHSFVALRVSCNTASVWNARFKGTCRTTVAACQKSLSQTVVWVCQSIIVLRCGWYSFMRWFREVDYDNVTSQIVGAEVEWAISEVQPEPKLPKRPGPSNMFCFAFPLHVSVANSICTFESV